MVNYYIAHTYASHIHSYLHPHTISVINTCIAYSADWHRSPPPVSSDYPSLSLYLYLSLCLSPSFSLALPPSCCLSFLCPILLCTFIFIHLLPNARFTTVIHFPNVSVTLDGFHLLFRQSSHLPTYFPPTSFQPVLLTSSLRSFRPLGHVTHILPLDTAHQHTELPPDLQGRAVSLRSRWAQSWLTELCSDKLSLCTVLLRGGDDVLCTGANLNLAAHRLANAESGNQLEIWHLKRFNADNWDRVQTFWYSTAISLTFSRMAELLSVNENIGEYSP